MDSLESIHFRFVGNPKAVTTKYRWLAQDYSGYWYLYRNRPKSNTEGYWADDTCGEYIQIANSDRLPEQKTFTINIGE